jgi:hypothetical protein
VTDRELIIEAIRKAGNQKALADVFGVAQSAISEWGRTRPIPRHARPRLQEFLKPDRSADTAHKEIGFAEGALPAGVQDLLQLLHPDQPISRLAKLPRRYRKRYEERVAELIARVKRELEEYQAVLEAEHRIAPPRRRRRSGN